MLWLRLYSEALHDPKVQLMPIAMFKVWVNLLMLANEGEPRGRLPSVHDIAYALRMKESATQTALDYLIKRGLLDNEAERLLPHRWDERQPARDYEELTHEQKAAGGRARAATAQREGGRFASNIPAAINSAGPATHQQPTSSTILLVPAPPGREEERREEKSRSEENGETSPSARVDEAFKLQLETEFSSVFGSREAVRGRIERAMNGKAYRGYTDKRRGLRGWLTAAAKDTRNGHEETKRSAAEAISEERYALIRRRAAANAPGDA